MLEILESDYPLVVTLTCPECGRSVTARVESPQESLHEDGALFALRDWANTCCMSQARRGGLEGRWELAGGNVLSGMVAAFEPPRTWR